MNHKVKLTYDPYRLAFKVSVDGKSIARDKHFQMMQDFIKKHTPLQTWIEPISYESVEWPGLLNAIARDENDNGSIVFEFTGRRIDFEDLRRAMVHQNEQRAPEAKLDLEFLHYPQFEEDTLRRNVDYVVSQLIAHKDEFLEGRQEPQLIAAYNSLQQNYDLARDKEFQIVFSGIFSSGKSTIINALIHRRLLPMGENTCTNSTIEVHHLSDSSIVKVQCYADSEGKKTVGEERSFSDDWACMDYLEEVRNANQDSSSVAMIKISTDLSHLYPSSMNSEAFRIVIVDTPGFESAETEVLIDGDTQNEHEQIAIDAINDPSRPIVVFCAENADGCELQNALTDIARVSKETNGGFNDRFLFVYSKCDRKQYNDDENLEGFVSNYAQRLLNFASTSEDENITNASNFIPRIFPVAALPSLAARYTGIFKDAKTNKEIRPLMQAYKTFAENLFDWADTNYFLSSCCGIPEYDIESIMDQYNQAVEDGRQADAVHLESGIAAIELAIRNYIERYAYPIKLRSLLETFDKILPDLKNVNQRNQNRLKTALERQKNAQSREEEVKSEQDKLAEEQARIKKLQDLATEKVKELQSLQFDREPLDRATDNFRVNFYGSSVMIELERIIRQDKGIVKCDYSEETIRKKCNDYWRKVLAEYKVAVSGSQSCCDELVANQRRNLTTILHGLQEIANMVCKDGAFTVGGADFTESLAWNEFIQFTIDEDTLERNLLKTVKHDTDVGTRMATNTQKYEYTRNPFKKVAQWFMKKEIPVTYTIHTGSYSIKPLMSEIENISARFALDISAIAEEFEENLRIMRDRANLLAESIMASIEAYALEAKELDDRISRIGSDIAQLQEEVTRLEGQGGFLNELIARMPHSIITEE